MRFLLNLLFPKTKLYFRQSGKEKLVVGPQELLDKMGYFGKIVFSANGYLYIQNTLDSNVSLGSSSINGVPFTDLELKEQGEK